VTSPGLAPRISVPDEGQDDMLNGKMATVCATCGSIEVPAARSPSTPASTSANASSDPTESARADGPAKKYTRARASGRFRRPRARQGRAQPVVHPRTQRRNCSRKRKPERVGLRLPPHVSVMDKRTSAHALGQETAVSVGLRNQARTAPDADGPSLMAAVAVVMCGKVKHAPRSNDGADQCTGWALRTKRFSSCVVPGPLRSGSGHVPDALLHITLHLPRGSQGAPAPNLSAHRDMTFG